MDNENTQRKFESVYSTKVRAGRRRTYFFDVRRTKGDDFYITLTESTKKFNSDGYERHKIFLYKEDFNRFLGSLAEVIDHVKNELMPDYDYEEFDVKQKEWEDSKYEKPSSTNTGEDIDDEVEDEVEDEIEDDSMREEDEIEDDTSLSEDGLDDVDAATEQEEVGEQTRNLNVDDEDMSW